MAELRPAPRRVRFERNELAGAFRDIGSDLPLLLALIPAAGLEAETVFLVAGNGAETARNADRRSDSARSGG